MNKAVLKECLTTLVRVRDIKHNELDPRVIAELDDVIEKITLLLETANRDAALDRALIERTLATLGRVAISLDWVRRIGQRFLE